MNHASITITIKDIKNLYDIIKASSAKDVDEIILSTHGKEHIPTEDGECFDPGYVVFTWKNVEYKVEESNEENT